MTNACVNSANLPLLLIEDETARHRDQEREQRGAVACTHGGDQARANGFPAAYFVS